MPAGADRTDLAIRIGAGAGGDTVGVPRLVYPGYPTLPVHHASLPCPVHHPPYPALCTHHPADQTVVHIQWWDDTLGPLPAPGPALSDPLRSRARVATGSPEVSPRGAFKAAEDLRKPREAQNHQNRLSGLEPALFRL